jgi:uncharacterized membrane protein YfcA
MARMIHRREAEGRQRQTCVIFRMSRIVGFILGIISGILGALSSSRGAEFRFPVLAGPARWRILPAIHFNLLVSLITTIVVCFLDRSGFIQFGILAAKWRIYVNVIPGSLFGAFFGAIWISKLDERRRKSWAIRALIFFGIFLIAYSWLVAQRIHFHAGFVRSVITIAGALLGGFLSSIIGTGSELIYIVTLAIFHDFSYPMGEAIASTAMLPTLLLSLAIFRRSKEFALPKKTSGLVAMTTIGSVSGILIVTRVFALNPGWLLHGVLGLLLIFSALRIPARPEASDT